ncbi:MAG: 3-methyl-2-oxobutanoate hydroxymethyltransferase [Actinobacteria bacterium]|nr:3-methyl-2-oxobutanoate hydroxymethyltransferase [Actinomycetota bacterium]
MNKLFPKNIQNLKGKRKITKVTALDYFSARAIEKACIDIIGLEGPPIEIYYKGAQNGLYANMEELIFCLRTIRRGAPDTFISVPIPYGFTQISHEEMLDAAVTLIKNGADAIKIEGGHINLKKIEKLSEQGIPCVSTIGLNTEIYLKEGFRCIGKVANEALQETKNALMLQKLGIIWLEIECMPYKVAAEITKLLKIPTIGIGSGLDCDGQFMHVEDLLGMHDRYYPKHCKKYLKFFEYSVESLCKFKEEVLAGKFPEEDNSFEINVEQFKSFKDRLISK